MHEVQRNPVVPSPKSELPQLPGQTRTNGQRANWQPGFWILDPGSWGSQRPNLGRRPEPVSLGWEEPSSWAHERREPRDERRNERTMFSKAVLLKTLGLRLFVKTAQSARVIK
ncbi:hypothetical protein E4U55_006829 [Claviceps digitariae]|nr:hypothetical protein E4U55_006829 [Claviceps digitariae]